MRFLRRRIPAVLVVRLPDGLQLAVPEWMLSPLACEQLKEEKEPRIATPTLQELRELVDIQPLFVSLRKSRCMQNLGQEALMHNNQNAGSHQKKLPFEIDRVWVALPVNVSSTFQVVRLNLFAHPFAFLEDSHQQFPTQTSTAFSHLLVRQSAPYQVRNHLESKERQ